MAYGFGTQYCLRPWQVKVSKPSMKMTLTVESSLISATLHDFAYKLSRYCIEVVLVG